MNHTIPHHLNMSGEHAAGNGSAGRFFFLPGSNGRARRIADRFSDLEELPSDRALNAYIGRLESGDVAVDVGVVATGMGCPSVDIVVTELITLGARRLLRVGTAGSLQPRAVRAGDLVIATAAVRDEGTSDAYIDRSYPAVADADVVSALKRAAAKCGMADHTFAGVVHSKDSLYAREFGHGSGRKVNRAYMDRLAEIGVLATEMEAAHLFVLAHVHTQGTVALAESTVTAGTVKAGALLAVIGDDRPFAPPDLIERTETAAIDVACEAAFELCRTQPTA